MEVEAVDFGFTVLRFTVEGGVGGLYNFVDVRYD